MRFLRFLVGLSISGVLAGCSCGAAVSSADAGTDAPIAVDAGATDAFVRDDDAGPPDSGAIDASVVDAHVDDAGAPDAGEATCPELGGGYTFTGSIPDACPAGTGTNVYDTAITVDDACRASIVTSDASSNRLRIVADVMLRPDGSWGPTLIMLNGTSVECTATYLTEDFRRMVFDCGDCDFTIRYGE